MSETPDYVPNWTTENLVWNAGHLFEAGYVKSESDWREFVRELERTVEMWFTN
jgi:hypothetical protein